MSTTHHQVVTGKCNSSEASEFTGENTLGRERNPVLFQVKWLLGSPGVGSLFPRVAGLDLGKLSAKSAQDCSENSVSHFKTSNNEASRALLEDEVGKMRARP